jgi:hypothetical protein
VGDTIAEAVGEDEAAAVAEAAGVVELVVVVPHAATTPSTRVATPTMPVERTPDADSGSSFFVGLLAISLFDR